MIQKNTHTHIDERLSGTVTEIGTGRSKVLLKTIPEMIVDDSGLIHGGFIFSLADHAAMVAINHPNVVLGAATVRFLAPVKVGDILVAEARANFVEGKKQLVEVSVFHESKQVFSGEFTCFVLEKHVLRQG